MHLAISNGHVETCLVFVEQTQFVQLCRPNGRTPLRDVIYPHMITGQVLEALSLVVKRPGILFGEHCTLSKVLWGKISCF